MAVACSAWCGGHGPRRRRRSTSGFAGTWKAQRRVSNEVWHPSGPPGGERLHNVALEDKICPLLIS